MISTLATLRYRGAHFGRIYGLIGIGMGLGGFFGAWIGGLLHDWTGGYAAVMIFSACALVLAAASLGSEAGARERRRAARGIAECTKLATRSRRLLCQGSGMRLLVT